MFERPFGDDRQARSRLQPCDAPREHAEKVSRWHLNDEARRDQRDRRWGDDDVLARGEVEAGGAGSLVLGKRYGRVQSADPDGDHPISLALRRTL